MNDYIHQSLIVQGQIFTKIYVFMDIVWRIEDSFIFSFPFSNDFSFKIDDCNKPILSKCKYFHVVCIYCFELPRCYRQNGNIFDGLSRSSCCLPMIMYSFFSYKFSKADKRHVRWWHAGYRKKTKKYVI